MAKPFAKLAQSLEQLRRLHNEKGIAVINPDQMRRKETPIMVYVILIF